MDDKFESLEVAKNANETQIKNNYIEITEKFTELHKNTFWKIKDCQVR